MDIFYCEYGCERFVEKYGLFVEYSFNQKFPPIYLRHQTDKQIIVSDTFNQKNKLT